MRCRPDKRSIAVASSGATDAQGTDRSVDLSFFPTDLFTKLTVNTAEG